MSNNNTLVFVSYGEQTQMLKVSDRKADTPIEFKVENATVLTCDGMDVPASQFEDLDKIRPFLKRA